MTYLLDKTVQVGVIQNRAWRTDVGLDHHDPATSVKHPNGKRTLNSCNLVMVQFHWVECAASVLIVLCIRAKDACQEDLRAGAEWVGFLVVKAGWIVDVTKLHLTL